MWRSRIRPVLARSDRLRAWRAGLLTTWSRLNPAGRVRKFDSLPPAAAVRVAYDVMLGRDPDDVGFEDYVTSITTGRLSRREMLMAMRGSPELRYRVPISGKLLGHSIHAGRSEFIRSLPPARRILDLGGTDLQHGVGAMVSMGYPYHFEELVIIDLPPDDRHPIYRQGGIRDVVESDLGRVCYRYHSMTDLSSYEDSSFDLVYSGQSIEHVTPDEGTLVLKEVFRVLRPGGYLALDTPNARVTRLAQDSFVDPDHKIEYTHRELSAKLIDAGFDIVAARGLNYAGRCLEAGRWDADAVASSPGVFFAIEDCYILAYLCQKPARMEA